MMMALPTTIVTVMMWQKGIMVMSAMIVMVVTIEVKVTMEMQGIILKVIRVTQIITPSS